MSTLATARAEREAFLQQALTAAREARSTNKHRFCPIIAAAQAALESNWGRSRLATEANNLKGVKAGSSWKIPVIELPTQEQRPDGSWYTTIARWRKYDSWAHAFEDYGALIERLYAHAAEVADDPRAFLEQLVAKDYPKYATDLAYVAKVWGIVEQYDMLKPLEPAYQWTVVVHVDGESHVIRCKNKPEEIVTNTRMELGRTDVRLS